MSLRRPINSIGNLEIDGNVLKYISDFYDYQVEDVIEIEHALQHKVKELGDKANYFLFPNRLEHLNSNVIQYFDLKEYFAFQFVRTVKFDYKLPFYKELIEIGKVGLETEILWNPLNFVVHLEEKKVKAILFETDNQSIYNNKSVLDGIKELIIVSLTDLYQLRKPTRKNFLEQQDYIIRFCETILKIDNLDDMKHFIEETIIEANERKAAEEEEGGQGKKSKKRLFKKKNPKHEYFIDDHRNQNKKKSNKKWYVGFGAAVAVGLLLNMGLLEEEKFDKLEGTRTGTLPKETNSEYNDQLIDAYRLAFIGEYDESIEIMDSIGLAKFDKMDRDIYVHIHREAGDLVTVLQIEPELGKEIVGELTSEGKFDELIQLKEELPDSNPYVDFEVAYYNQDYATVVKNRKKVDMNGRKEEQIFQSYLALEDYDNAEKFAKEVGNTTLLQEVEMYKSIAIEEE